MAYAKLADRINREFLSPYELKSIQHLRKLINDFNGADKKETTSEYFLNTSQKSWKLLATIRVFRYVQVWARKRKFKGLQIMLSALILDILRTIPWIGKNAQWFQGYKVMVLEDKKQSECVTVKYYWINCFGQFFDISKYLDKQRYKLVKSATSLVGIGQIDAETRKTETENAILVRLHKSDVDAFWKACCKKYDAPLMGMIMKFRAECLCD